MGELRKQKRLPNNTIANFYGCLVSKLYGHIFISYLGDLPVWIGVRSQNNLLEIIYMAWFVGLIAVIAFLGFLFNYPKQTLGCAAVLVGGLILLYYVFIDAPEKERKRTESMVNIAIQYDAKRCGKDFPLLISAINNSKKTVEKIELTIGVFVPGHSTDLSGYNNNYKLDKILQPGEGYGRCFELPSTLKYSRELADQLEYRLSNYGKSITFR
jgi:hypothetical protein